MSWVPEQGTVGASGDLAPLSHLALGLMGEGQMWSPETGWGDAKYVSITFTTRNLIFKVTQMSEHTQPICCVLRPAPGAYIPPPITSQIQNT